MCGNSYSLGYVNSKFRSENLFLKNCQLKVTLDVLNLSSSYFISKGPLGNLKGIRLTSRM